MKLPIPHSRATLALTLGAALLGLLGGSLLHAAPLPGGGCGHDPRLDAAQANLVKAEALIAASSNPGVVPPFGGHDVRARRAIQLAQHELAAAVLYAENSCR